MKPARLLVAEDEKSLRETLRAHLTELGYEVLATESATAAMNQIQEFDPDLVLSDVQMPGMSGFEFLAYLREHRPQTDVIIFTGHADVGGAIKAMKSGATDYLIKPLDLDEAEGVIERCLAKRQCMKDSEPDLRYFGKKFVGHCFDKFAICLDPIPEVDCGSRPLRMKLLSNHRPLLDAFIRRLNVNVAGFQDSFYFSSGVQDRTCEHPSRDQHNRQAQDGEQGDSQFFPSTNGALQFQEGFVHRYGNNCAPNDKRDERTQDLKTPREDDENK